jgi:hypothetical protein
MGLKEDFVNKARAEEGTVEGPKNNETKYGKFTKHDFQPWCGSYLMWCANEVGYKKMPNLVYTPAGAEAFKGLGAWSNAQTAKPQIGDIGFCIFTPGGKLIEHVFTVVKDNGDGTVVTMEGNTTPDKKEGSQANGGEVCMKVRAYKTDNKRNLPVFVVGFGRPKWTN